MKLWMSEVVGGLHLQRLRINVHLAPILIKRQNVTWRWDRGPIESPEAYMGEATLPTDPTQGRTIQLPWALGQHGGIVAKETLSCCSVAPTTQLSTKDWISMNGSPRLTIGYLLRREFWIHVYEGLVTQPWIWWSGVRGVNHAHVWHAPC